MSINTFFIYVISFKYLDVMFYNIILGTIILLEIYIGDAFSDVVISLTNNFIQTTLNFLIMAFVLFCPLNRINKSMSSEQKTKETTTLLQKSFCSAKSNFDRYDNTLDFYYSCSFHNIYLNDIL